MAVLIGGGLVLSMNSCSSSSSGPSGIAASALSSPFETSSSVDLSSTFKGARAFPSVYTDRAAVLQRLKDETSNDDNCTFTIDLTRDTTAYASCYGPDLLLSGTHPDGAVPSCPSSGGNPNPLPGGDTGIWNSTDDGTEACTAAQINKLMDYHTKKAYFAQVAGMALKCFVTSNSLSLPAVGESALSLDSTQLSDFGFTNFVPSSASVSAITDNNGVEGYKYTVEGNVTYSETTGAPAAAVPFSISFQYTEETDGGFRSHTTYIFRDDSTTNDTGHCAALTGYSSTGSLTATQASSSSNVLIQLDHANFCGTTYNPFTDLEPDVRPCDKATKNTDSDSTNGWGANYNRLNFDFNPNTEVGTYAYAWEAGNTDAWTRVFNAQKTSSTVGVGYFGFGPDVASDDNSTACEESTDLGNITGMICNWTGPGNNRTRNDYVQKQAMQKNAAGVWTVTSENIIYAPVNSCTVSGSDLAYYAVTGSGASACSESSTGKTLDSATVIAAGTRLDLESLADYDTAWTAPTAPGNF